VQNWVVDGYLTLQDIHQNLGVPLGTLTR
jgi:hypothetical protein